jgi:hypothetical protein
VSVLALRCCSATRVVPSMVPTARSWPARTTPLAPDHADVPSHHLADLTASCTLDDDETGSPVTCIAQAAEARLSVPDEGTQSCTASGTGTPDLHGALPSPSTRPSP